jgi:hypothetical protein
VTDLWAIESRDACGEWLARSGVHLFRDRLSAERSMQWIRSEYGDEVYRLVHYIAATEDT